MKKVWVLQCVFVCVCVCVHVQVGMGVPLSSESRWVVDEETGTRTKLACVNWAAHLEAAVAEGLSKQPLDTISNKIRSMGFNCVRLTWPLYLATNHTLASISVRHSFTSLGLIGTISGLQANNPDIIDLSLIQAFQAVVKSLADNNVMIILDNHISQPGWCCSSFDDNGFFGDKCFDPHLWVKGLTKMASLFSATPYVVGMSLRNELRGPKQNVNAWYRYMRMGAEAVHSANPKVLVILSGLSYDTDLSFVRNHPVSLTFKRKLVFEMHWYGFTDGDSWTSGNPNQVCGRVVEKMKRASGYLLDQGYPLFVSEFGMDLRGTNVNDNRYMTCFLGVAAELDLDWALWTVVGSYYLRDGVSGMNEFYGLMDWDWSNLRSSTFLDRIYPLQSPFQGPGLAEVRPHKVIFHPQTGLCVLRKTMSDPPKLGPCSETESWTYTRQRNLLLKGTYFCIQALEQGKPVKLSITCSDPSAKWEMISDSRMHLSSSIGNGAVVCLDVDPGNNDIVTNSCKCLSQDNACDPASQWFKLVDSTRSYTATRPFTYSILNNSNSSNNEIFSSA